MQGRLGIIGLGLVGGALAERFIAAGYSVMGYDLSHERRAHLATLGGQPAQTALEVAEHCDRLILSLSNSDVVAAVVQQIAPALRAGQVIVDTTTGDPEPTVALAARLAEKQVHYLDATIAGSSAQVRAGTVTVIAGGDTATFQACEDLFACFAQQWFRVGASGSGAMMKLVVNLVIGLNRANLAEALTLARRSGLDGAEALKILKAGAAYSRVMDAKGPKMLAENFEPEAKLSQHLKDVRSMLALAKRVGARLPLSTVHAALLAQAEAAGYGERDNSAIIKAFETEA